MSASHDDEGWAKLAAHVLKLAIEDQRHQGAKGHRFRFWESNGFELICGRLGVDTDYVLEQSQSHNPCQTPLRT